MSDTTTQELQLKITQLKNANTNIRLRDAALCEALRIENESLKREVRELNSILRNKQTKEREAKAAIKRPQKKESEMEKWARHQNTAAIWAGGLFLVWLIIVAVTQNVWWPFHLWSAFENMMHDFAMRVQ